MKTLGAAIAGGLIGALVVWVLMGGGASVFSKPSPQQGIPTAMAPGGHLREFHLETRPAKWEIAPGIVTDAWTYNGRVPGPELRVTEGDLVRVVVTNHLPVPTTVHWHGVDLNYKMDGVPGVTQAPIAPGATFTYEFVASPAGTRMYHSHVDTNAQLELGLYGALIIEPRNGPKYDVDRTIILDERALDFTPDVALGRKELPGADAGNGRGGALQYDLFLMDGKAGPAIPPIRVKPHQRVLLRLINLGNLTHAIHLHGHTFTIVATDGNPVPPGGRLRKDTVQLSPGERYDLEVDTYNPGVWMFHCHMPNHGDNGMMTLFQYEGFQPVTPAGHAMHLPVRRQPAAATPSHVVVSRTVIVPMLDNHFRPAQLVVHPGTRVVWINRGSNVHTTTSFNGLWDSPGLERRQQYAFTFAKPGEYRYLCRQHLLTGMTGIIVVK
ncbi:MAG TPA: multicopper oxidase domain-containing protein [bacterium]|jgi:FtsP/CotA-like multicopper oxidase with cupredoxin domain/plastocyanin